MHIVPTAGVDMLQDLHGAISKLLILLRKIVLDHPEDVLQIDLIGRSASLECLVDDQACEAGNLLLGAAHALNQLRVEERGLAALKHREQDLEANVSKIRLVCRSLLQKVVMHGKGHRLDIQGKLHICVHHLVAFERGNSVLILDHLLQ